MTAPTPQTLSPSQSSGFPNAKKTQKERDLNPQTRVESAKREKILKSKRSRTSNSRVRKKRKKNIKKLRAIPEVKTEIIPSKSSRQ